MALVDVDLDRRLAEAAADVESLRQECHKLDLELEERRHYHGTRLSAHATARAGCPPEATAAAEQATWPAASPLEAIAAAEEASRALERHLQPSSEAAREEAAAVASSFGGGGLQEEEALPPVPSPPPPPASEPEPTASEGASASAAFPPFAGLAEEGGASCSSQKVQQHGDSQQAEPTIELPSPASVEEEIAEASNEELEALWNEYLPGPPSLCMGLRPADSIDPADGSSELHPTEALPPPEPPPDPAPAATTATATATAAARSARRRPEEEQLLREDRTSAPSFQDVAGMSRRERIALLELEEQGGYGTTAGQEPRPQQQPSQAGVEMEEDESPSRVISRAARAADALKFARGGLTDSAAATLHTEQDINHLSRRERIALLERGAGGPPHRPTAPPAEWEEFAQERPAHHRGTSQVQGDGLDNEDEFELRRQQRKARLQQHRSAQGHGRTVADGPVSPPAPLPAATPTSDLRERLDAGSGSTDVSPQQAVEELARVQVDAPRFITLCNSLANGAHKLNPGLLVRAVEVLSAGSSPNSEAHMATLRLAAEAVLTSLTPQLGSLGAQALVDALKAMAVTKVSEQTYLDMLLAQLLVLLRRERASFSPPLLSSIAGALGRLQEAGMSAKRASSGASSTANQRCLELLGELVVGELAHFAEEDVALAGGAYLVNFLDDVQRRAVLRRAAELQAGLRVSPPSESWVTASLVRVERSVRGHSFAFVASLPDETKDYLMQLKASGS